MDCTPPFEAKPGSERNVHDDQPGTPSAIGSSESDTLRTTSDCKGKVMEGLAEQVPVSTNAERHARKKLKHSTMNRSTPELTRIKHKGGRPNSVGQSKGSVGETIYEEGSYPKKGDSTEMDTDDGKLSAQDGMVNGKPDVDMFHSYALDSDMVEGAEEVPGSSGEEADIDSCSAGSCTGEGASRRAHKLRAAVVCKDGHVPPQGQQHEGDCMVASRLLQLWTAVPAVHQHKNVGEQGSVAAPHHGQVIISC